MSEWKPGDVAICLAANGPGNESVPTEYPMARSRTGWSLLSNADYFWSDGASCRPVRPLVVIDPEDAEQAERLLSMYVAPFDEYVTDGRMQHMQAALREFARPTPRIEEPQGLGAVVEDVSGDKWVRCPDTDNDAAPWVRCAARIEDSGVCEGWSHVAATRVLSHGVTEGAS